jgi:plasmid maintenance system antidote protein VapI
MLQEIIEGKELDIRQQFKNYMRSHGVSVSSAARELHITRNHFRHILIQDRDLTEINRSKLNEYLGTDF